MGIKGGIGGLGKSSWRLQCVWIRRAELGKVWPEERDRSIQRRGRCYRHGFFSAVNRTDYSMTGLERRGKKNGILK